MNKSKKNFWKNDENKEFRINPELVKRYFNKTLSLVFGKKDAEKEKIALLPFINITKESKVLDLGCGNGRWADILVKRCAKYVGVDFSEGFIRAAQKRIKNENVKFICLPAQDYLIDEQYDSILAIGLITYMNDEEIKKLSVNCKKMLKKGGRLILRNVVLENGQVYRRVFDRKSNFLRKLLRKPDYQIIRRNMKEELSLFREFRLVYTQRIEETGYRFYIFE